MTQETKGKILRNLYLQKSFGYRFIEPFRLKQTVQMNHFMSQETLKECNLCDAAKISKDKVFAFGNQNSQILFITIVPTMDPTTLETFTKMIQNVLGISLENIHLISLIKCNVSEKTPNLESYYQKCKGYIENQLATTQAKLIVTLGESYNYLCETKSDLSQVRGTVIKWQDKNLIPIYHPNFLLRNPSLKKETFEDLKKIKLLLEQL